MNRSSGNTSHNKKPEWWRRLIAFIFTIVIMHELAFDTVPGLIRHDIHKLPDGFYCLFLLILSFGTWYIWMKSQILANILLVIMFASFIAAIVSGIILDGIRCRYLPPLILTIIILGPIFIMIAIRERKSGKPIDDNESAQNVSGEN